MCDSYISLGVFDLVSSCVLGELDVLGHDGGALGGDGAQVRVLEQAFE